MPATLVKTARFISRNRSDTVLTSNPVFKAAVHFYFICVLQEIMATTCLHAMHAYQCAMENLLNNFILKDNLYGPDYIHHSECRNTQCWLQLSHNLKFW